MICTDCRREVGYHPPTKDGKPRLIICPRTGRPAEIREEDFKR